jgi:hypothetical protein
MFTNTGSGSESGSLRTTSTNRLVLSFEESCARILEQSMGGKEIGTETEPEFVNF